MRARPAVFAAILVLLAAVPARAQTAAELFDVNTLHEVRLSVNSRDLAKLRQNFGTNTYYPADLTWKNVKVRNVGIRSRGLGSRNPNKLGLRVDIARYTSGQKFVGLSSLVLDNIWQDDSMLRERLAFTFFERMLEPAPLESFCRLYINNVYQGLYAITEEIDADFVRRVTGETNGFLFEYHWVQPWRAEDLQSVANYKTVFEPRTRALEADATLYHPIQQTFAEVNAAEDSVWRERVGQYLDLQQFMRHVAIEQFMLDNDGIVGHQGMNNFYLYRSAGSNKHRLFTWDRDQSFLFPAGAVAMTSDNVIFNRAIAHDDLRDIYLSTLEACANLAKGDGFLLSEIDRLTTLIFDAARADTRKKFTNDEFDAAIEWLRQWAVNRPNEVLADVARIRRGQ